MFQTIQELLVKGGLAGHFAKMAAHHDALAKAHDALQKKHSEHAAMVKARLDGMKEDHPDYQLHKAQHELHMCKADHHKELAGLNKTMCTHCGGVADGMSEKAASAPVQKCAHEIEMTKACKDCKREEVSAAVAPAADLTKFMQESISEAMSALKGTDSFKKLIQDAVMRQAEEALGKSIVPDGVQGTHTAGPKLVPRSADLAKLAAEPVKLPADMAHVFERRTA